MIQPHVFLKTVRIQNVRALRNVELSFATESEDIRRWTLIIGENGFGKSTLLRSIALVMAGSESLADLLVDPDSWITRGAKGAAIEADVVTADREPRTFRLEWRRGQRTSGVIKANDQNLRALDDALSHTQRSYLTVGYGVSRRLSAGQPGRVVKEGPALQPRSRAVATLFDPDAELQSLESWAMDLHYRRGKGGLDVVRNALRGLLPSVEFHSIDRETRRLLFDTPDGLVPIAQLSDGYQNVAAWTGDLLYRITESFRNYKRPLSARGLLLIDELDLHLHPLWQRRLREFLDEKLPNFQIVATTHSALTGQQAAAGELFYFTRDRPKAGPVLRPFAGEPQKLMSHQLLLSDVFGVATLNSLQIEDRRQRYRALRAKKRPTPSQKREKAALEAELRDIPDWSRPTRHDEETLRALKAIEQALASVPAAAPTADPRRRSRQQRKGARP
jgi:predicted ATPase